MKWRIPFWLQLAAFTVLMTGSVVLATGIRHYETLHRAMNNSFTARTNSIASVIGINHALDFLARQSVNPERTIQGISSLLNRERDILYVLFKTSDGKQFDYFIRPGADVTRAVSVERDVIIEGEAVPGVSGMRRVGSIAVGYEDYFAEMALRSRRDLLQFGGVISLFGLLLATTLAYYFTRPLYRVMDGMTRVENGDMSAQVTVTRRDELGRLSSAFNRMVEGLRAKQELLTYVSASAWKEAHRRAAHGSTQSLAERRIVTILFSDICGFTSLSEQLAPDEMVLVLNDYFDSMTSIIQEEGGAIDKFIGDAIMAVFDGEDSAVALAAIRAGLRMQEAVARTRFHDQRLEIRVGINTGSVIFGDIGSAGIRRDHTCIGDTVNRAQRMEQICEPGGVTCGESTFDLVSTVVEADAPRRIHLKGIAADTPVYRVRRVMVFPQ